MTFLGIETDIHKTSDGSFVTCHDKTLHRISGENISVEETTLSELQNIVLLDKDGSKNRLDLRLSTLENYISICKKYGKHSFLELKSEFSDEEILNLINIIKKLNYLENVTFISFSFDNLVKVRNILPSQAVQYIVNKISKEITNKIISNKFDIDAYYKALNEKHIKRFHDAGLVVNCWTVDKKKIAENLALMGVDYITTNILE